MTTEEVKATILKHINDNFRFKTNDDKMHVGEIKLIPDNEKIKFIGWVKTPHDPEDKYEGNKFLNYSDIIEVDFISKQN